MFNKKIIATFLITGIILATSLTVYAKDYAQDLYNQLVVNRQATASIYAEDADSYKIIDQFLSIDDKNNPYDGAMIICQGTAFNVKKYSDGREDFGIINPFNIYEAEELLDKMESEIRSELDEDTDQKETLNQIIKYISHTYTYDFTARSSDGKNQNFVDAYNNGNRKIICNQYAALTYLLCDRFGIDCLILSGNDHRFNGIRLDGEDNYTAYDLTKTTFFMPAKVAYVDLITTNYSLELEKQKLSKAIGYAMNKGIDFHYSITIEEIIIFVVIISLTYIMFGKASMKKHVTNRNRNHRKP